MRRAFLRQLFLSSLAAVTVGLAPPAPALEPGDLVVADTGPPEITANGSIVAIDPATGAQRRITAGLHLYNPLGIAIEASGAILVADTALAGGSVVGRVVRVDPETGAQTLLAIRGSIDDPHDVAVAPNGEIFVSQGTPLAPLLRIDPVTGRQTDVFGQPLASLGSPFGIALEPDGRVLASDYDGDRILRVNPPTKAISTLVPRDGIREPLGIALSPLGPLYVASGVLRAIYRVDPASGSRALLSSFGLLEFPRDVALAADGGLFVVDAVARSVLAVHPLSGAQTLVSSGGLIQTPTGIAVVPGGPSDSDDDGLLDRFDICPEAADSGQSDLDADGLGDACDPFPEEAENLLACVEVRDAAQARVDALAAEQRLLSSQLDALAQAQAALLAERARLLAADGDGDRVADVQDACPGTHPSHRTDASGCSQPQRAQRGRVQ
jgi:DNA-binding beta-propeller fold protein YncE